MAIKQVVSSTMSSTNSRAVQSTVQWEHASTVISVGATARDGGPWPDPRLSFGDSLHLNEMQWDVIASEVSALFEEYARLWPREAVEGW